jgi:hypothetical protein
MPDHPPTVISTGVFLLGGVALTCHVLSNGQRVIDAESLERLLGEGVQVTEEEAVQFARWMKGVE